MKINLRKKIAIAASSAAVISQSFNLYAADTFIPEDIHGQIDMSQDEKTFANKLSGWSKDAFMKMSHQSRSIVMKIANHGCRGKNSCKGQGGCKSDSNSCKGQNACKGKGSCTVSAGEAVTMEMNRRKM